MYSCSKLVLIKAGAMLGSTFCRFPITEHVMRGRIMGIWSLGRKAIPASTVASSQARAGLNDKRNIAAAGRLFSTATGLQKANPLMHDALSFRPGHASQRSALSSGAASLQPELSMPVVIPTRNVPIMLYADPSEIEAGALKQLTQMAESPLPVGYVAAMPDVHIGKGATVGTVFASEKYIMPMAVGVDIGCGMCAVPLDGLHKDDISMAQMTAIQSKIKERIPTGFNEHKAPRPQAHVVLDEISHANSPSLWLMGRAQDMKARRQLGTLGGGNHFLEVVYDESGRVWIMLHSGSRHIGNITAQRYDEVGMQELKAKGVRTQKDGFNYLEADSESGRSYLGDMKWCQDYAFHNRKFMLDLMIDAVNEVTGASPDLRISVNIHHNYCSCERCSYKDPRTGQQIDKDLWVTRKGATSAQKGQLGIIPGSMATGSYIVRGKGEPSSWSSCSHGAGRRLSRTKARSDISQDEFEKAMQGVVTDVVPAVRDEAPQAYKDLAQVMANQADLVDVVHKLRPLINVKGYEEKRR